MIIEGILSKRHLPYRFWMDLVFEWEDVLSDMLNIPFKNDFLIDDRRTVRILNRKVCGLFKGKVGQFLIGRANLLKFDITTYSSEFCNYPNVVPIIIDFYDRVPDLSRFYERYSNHRVIFISSKEAFDLLRKNGCPLNIYHLPLSISDKYRITSSSTFDKKYDLLIMGRQNPVFEKWLLEYKAKRTDFTYVHSIWEQKHPLDRGTRVYYTSEGTRLGPIKERQDYIRFLRSSRIALYSTPGKDANTGDHRYGFNQVTPRFLEFLACGCNVLCRYDSSPDTRWYELDKYWPSIENYSQFEEAMDNARIESPNIAFYSDFLERHYTSKRVECLMDVLCTLD